MTIKIEMTEKPDAGALAAIHNACFDKAWGEAAIADMMAIEGTRAFTAHDGTGFALLRHVGDDAEILTLAVLPGQRKRGVGSALVAAMCAWARAQGAAALFLEVAERNEAARALYGKNGFSVISRRKEYYQNPDGTHEHALIMRRRLVL